MERCPSGLRGSLGKRVNRKVSGVRIPLSPPTQFFIEGLICLKRYESLFLSFSDFFELYFFSCYVTLQPQSSSLTFADFSAEHGSNIKSLGIKVGLVTSTLYLRSMLRKDA